MFLFKKYSSFFRNSLPEKEGFYPHWHSYLLRNYKLSFLILPTVSYFSLVCFSLLFQPVVLIKVFWNFRRKLKLKLKRSLSLRFFLIFIVTLYWMSPYSFRRFRNSILLKTIWRLKSAVKRPAFPCPSTSGMHWRLVLLYLFLETTLFKSTWFYNYFFPSW